MSAFLLPAAVALSRRNQLSLWDALIVVAARICGASEVLSEDLHSGQIIEGQLAVNPFMTT